MASRLARTLSNITPGRVKGAAFRVRKLFWKATRPDLAITLGHLKRWGYDPSAIIDVGAYVGEWTEMIRKTFPAAKVLMVEAQESKGPTLRKVCEKHAGRVVLENTLLGPADGQAVRFVEMETGSSVFEEESPYDRTVVEKTQMTLDTVVARHPGFDRATFLKLDVQGYELEVLKGASRLLQGLEFVLMEASLIPINRGCPVVADVCRFMADRDFPLLDICSMVRRRDGYLWQTDLLFVNRKSQFLPKPALDSSNWV